MPRQADEIARAFQSSVRRVEAAVRAIGSCDNPELLGLVELFGQSNDQHRYLPALLEDWADARLRGALVDWLVMRVANEPEQAHHLWAAIGTVDTDTVRGVLPGCVDRMVAGSRDEPDYAAVLGLLWIYQDLPSLQSALTAAQASPSEDARTDASDFLDERDVQALSSLNLPWWHRREPSDAAVAALTARPTASARLTGLWAEFREAFDQYNSAAIAVAFGPQQDIVHAARTETEPDVFLRLIMQPRITGLAVTALADLGEAFDQTYLPALEDLVPIHLRMTYRAKVQHRLISAGLPEGAARIDSAVTRYIGVHDEHNLFVRARSGKHDPA